MDEVHLAIGVASVVALILIVANSMSYVGGRVADQANGNVSELVIRIGPVTDQLTAVEGEPALVEGDYVNATCSAVHSIGSTACALVGPLLARLPSQRKVGDEGEEKDAEAKPKPDAETKPKPEPETAEGPGTTAKADPQGEE